MKEQRQARMQHLADNNPYKSGNMTEVLELRATNPELAKRLEKEAGVGAPDAIPEGIHQRQAEAMAREAQVEAMNRSQARSERGGLPDGDQDGPDRQLPQPAEPPTAAGGQCPAVDRTGTACGYCSKRREKATSCSCSGCAGHLGASACRRAASRSAPEKSMRFSGSWS